MATTQNLSTGVLVDTSAFKNFAKTLRKVAPDLAKELRTNLRKAGDEVAEIARAKASAFSSTRIPPSVRVRVRGVAIFVEAGGKDAPNAAPIENKGRGHVRHPVFIPKSELPGPRGSWTSKNSPPAFLTPAAKEGQELVVAKAVEALDAVIAKIPLEFK